MTDEKEPKRKSNLPAWSTLTPVELNNTLRKLVNALSEDDDRRLFDPANTPQPPTTAQTPTSPQAAVRRLTVLRSSQPLPEPAEADDDTGLVPVAPPDETPWTLQQFFEGEIDLDIELSKRFPSLPMLTRIKFRPLSPQSRRHVATLTSQDGAAMLTVDADSETRVIQMAFTLGSMITVRFVLNNLSDNDRDHWLELMRREQGGLAFLWGPARWANDYLICISRRYFTNVYAFSPGNIEAAVRLAPDVTRQLLDWLDDVWRSGDDADDSPPPDLLTW